ncbi:MAG: hypothetical protein AVDCRST_MAG35-1128, partial [uncultured Quadrisphaera sp.]
ARGGRRAARARGRGAGGVAGARG